eukprot:COSAG06_NODE_56_length_27627_cov_106.527136_13_plen_57_part_00
MFIVDRDPLLIWPRTYGILDRKISTIEAKIGATAAEFRSLFRSLFLEDYMNELPVR